MQLLSNCLLPSLAFLAAGCLWSKMKCLSYFRTAAKLDYIDFIQATVIPNKQTYLFQTQRSTTAQQCSCDGVSHTFYVISAVSIKAATTSWVFKNFSFPSLCSLFLQFYRQDPRHDAWIQYNSTYKKLFLIKTVKPNNIFQYLTMKGCLL